LEEIPIDNEQMTNTFQSKSLMCGTKHFQRVSYFHEL